MTSTLVLALVANLTVPSAAKASPAKTGPATTLGPKASAAASAATQTSAANGNPNRVLVDRIVAVVNNEVILASELEAAEAPFKEQNVEPEKKRALDKDILDQLIYDRLLSQQIDEARLDATDDEVDRAIKDILRQNKISMEDLESAIRARGMSLGQYKEDIKHQLVRLKIVDLKVRSRVVVPESEIEAEFQRKYGAEKPEELLHIRHVFLRYGDAPTKTEKARVMAEARKAYERIRKGEPFEDVAKAVSQGPTASSGGDLGELTESSLLPELARALKDQPAGTLTPPIDTANGIHVVRLESRTAGTKKKFEAERDRIHQELYQKEVERQMRLWLEEVRNQSAIDIRL